MKRRVAILTEIISPYRIPVFNALAAMSDIDLHVIFLAETDTTMRQWKIYKDEIRFSYQTLPHWRRRVRGYNVLLNRGMIAALEKAKPEVVVLGGYSYVAMWQALRWARKQGIPVFLWSESNAQDRRRSTSPVEYLKKTFLRGCSGFIVPGKSPGEYLKTFGVPERVIFTAPNAVDNDFFAGAAAAARSKDAALRAKLGLPGRYYLFVGRMIREKGIFELLRAYCRLEPDLRERVGLMYVGDGASRDACEKQTASIHPGQVAFSGFVHREELAVYYALAECLVFPTFSDPWGLVVNEAMACGLPVIATSVAGCVADLVEDGRNGRVIAAGAVDALSAAMRQVVDNDGLRVSMGKRSAELIANSTAQTWAEGFAQAVMARQVEW
jgi:glycosyltransferase involved in cell wall biosynthesis